jgi:hypothetical protein
VATLVALEASSSVTAPVMPASRARGAAIVVNVVVTVVVVPASTPLAVVTTGSLTDVRPLLAATLTPAILPLLLSEQ